MALLRKPQAQLKSGSFWPGIIRDSHKPFADGGYVWREPVCRYHRVSSKTDNLRHPNAGSPSIDNLVCARAESRSSRQRRSR